MRAIFKRPLRGPGCSDNCPGYLFLGVQYHPELHFQDIAGYLERSDIDGFAKTTGAIGLNAQRLI